MKREASLYKLAREQLISLSVTSSLDPSLLVASTRPRLTVTMPARMSEAPADSSGAARADPITAD